MMGRRLKSCQYFIEMKNGSLVPPRLERRYRPAFKIYDSGFGAHKVEDILTSGFQ
jgi:hypothetical protein